MYTSGPLLCPFSKCPFYGPLSEQLTFPGKLCVHKCLSIQRNVLTDVHKVLVQFINRLVNFCGDTAMTSKLRVL